MANGVTVIRRGVDIQAVLAAYHVPDGRKSDAPSLGILAGYFGAKMLQRLYQRW